MLKRVTCVALPVVMTASFLSLATGAPATADTGCPTASASLSGSGTSGSPYIIGSAADLQEFKDKTSGTNYWAANVYVELSGDIDMQGCVWSAAIAPNTTPYLGKFNGNGFTISGLSVSDSTNSRYVGLFGYAGTGAEIYDLTFTGNVTGGSGVDYVGGLIGGAFNDSAFRNVHVSGAVSGDQYVGGLIGYASTTGTISSSSAAGDVLGTGNDVGGLIGILQSSSVSNSFAAGNVQGNSNVGGLVGSQSNSTITDTYASGAVTASASGGGLVGGTTSPTVTDSYWDTDTSLSTSQGGTGKTTAELQDITTFGTWDIASGFDASSTWGICSAVNDGYPFLTGAYSSDPCSSGGIGASGSLETIYTLTLQPAEGTTCSVASVSGLKNTWVDLPTADACTPPESAPESVLLGWSTRQGFPVDIAQRQVTGGMGAYELTDESGIVTNIFIPSGGSAFIVAPNRLYAVWSESPTADFESAAQALDLITY